jgi:hypothetical protein
MYVEIKSKKVSIFFLPLCTTGHRANLGHFLVLVGRLGEIHIHYRNGMIRRRP